MTTNNSNNSNGNANRTVTANNTLETMETITTTEQLETAQQVNKTEQPKPKKKTRKRNDNNKIQHVDLVLDAGSHNCKAMVDGYSNSFASMFKEIKGELPSGMAGVFSYNNKNYVVGKLSQGFQGKETIHAFKDNKISKLDIWLIGALTYDCDFLDSLIEHPTVNKYKSKPIQLHINLKLLSLSSGKKGDITKILTNINAFTYRNKEFQITFTNLEEEYIYSEGFGSALTAKSMSPDDREFYILDLGGGTLTLTQYFNGRDKPKANDRIIATGGGMEVVGECIFKAVAKSDMGGQGLEMSGIFAALKACRIKDGNYFTPYSLGRKNIDISQSIPDGLDNWILENPTIKKVLNEARRVLNAGHKVYATGGGFACGLIAQWISNYLIEEIEVAQFEVLSKPESINVTGMKLLNRGTNIND
ncbi:MAG: hypothetical protein AAF208_06725 [Cyanobacteria bacterium P01_A01_bin.45]